MISKIKMRIIRDEFKLSLLRKDAD